MLTCEESQAKVRAQLALGVQPHQLWVVESSSCKVCQGAGQGGAEHQTLTPLAQLPDDLTDLQTETNPDRRGHKLLDKCYERGRVGLNIRLWRLSRS
jgi:hypothetical protein